MKRTLWTLIKILIVVFIPVSIVLWFWQRCPSLSARLPIDDNIFNNFGGFVGGTLGTIVLIFTLWYAYRTYKHSVKNQIESRFFQLLSVVGETRKGLLAIDKDIFGIYIRYIGVFYQIIDKYKKKENKNWSYGDMLKVAYLYFFYGVEKLNDNLIANVKTISEDDTDELRKKIKDKGYKLDRHVYKDLGIYFRQLYQTVTYIDKQTNLDYEEKYNLIKSLRSTINIEEQYLLFVNSITSVGLAWEKHNDIEKNIKIEIEIDKKIEKDIKIVIEKDKNKNTHNSGLITKYNLITNLPEHYNPIKDIRFNDSNYGYPNVQYEYLGEMKSEERKKLEKEYETK